MQPGPKNLIDRFLEAWFRRPAAITSYLGAAAGGSAGGVWHGTLCETGVAVISSTLAVGSISQALSEDAAPVDEGGPVLKAAFPGFADDLASWIEAARTQRARRRTAGRGARDPLPVHEDAV